MPISVPHKSRYFLHTRSSFKNLKKYFTLGNCLFGSVELTKNADVYKYKYSGYGIGFDTCSYFLFTYGSYGKKCLCFGAHMNSSVHVDNKGKGISILGKDQYGD